MDSKNISLNRILVIRRENKIGLRTQAIIRWRLVILNLIQTSLSPLRGLTEEPHTIGADSEITKKVRTLENHCNEIQNKQRSVTGFIPLILFLALVTLCHVLNCFQILITNLSAWIELSQPIVPECGNTIEDAEEINSTYCKIFVERMSDPITHFLRIQTNLSEMYRPRFECTQVISLCNYSVCNLWNAEEFHIKPDPFRRDNPICVNEIEIAFLVVTCILAMSGLLLAYRWKNTVEVLGIEAKVYHLRKLSRSFSIAKTPFPSIIRQFNAPRRKASQYSSVFTIGSNEDEYNSSQISASEEAPMDIAVKIGKSVVGLHEKASKHSSTFTIGSNVDECNISPIIAFEEAPMDIKSSVVLGSNSKVSDNNSADSPLFTIIEKDQHGRDVPARAEFVSFVSFLQSEIEGKYIAATEDTSSDSSILTIGQNQVGD